MTSLKRYDLTCNSSYVNTDYGQITICSVQLFAFILPRSASSSHINQYHDLEIDLLSGLKGN